MNELAIQYSLIQSKIQEEASKPVRGANYSERVKTKILALLASLRGYTEKWSRKNVPQIYLTARKSTARKLKGIDIPDLSKLTVNDRLSIENAIINLNSYLDTALRDAEQQISRTIDRAQNESYGNGGNRYVKSVIEKHVENGVPSKWYYRDYDRVTLSLAAYAAMVTGDSIHEIENSANLNLNSDIGNDLVLMSEHYGSCPICEPYQGRVYSVSGTNPNYPALYDTPWSSMYENFHPHCVHILTPYIERLEDAEVVKERREYSNRSFEIGGSGWTKAQTERAERSLAEYRTQQTANRQLYLRRKQFERYTMVLGDKAPKSFSAFSRIKAAGGERWRELQREYRLANAEMTT